MSDRVFAIAWIGVCVIIAAQMYFLTVPFTYEPVGPKVFPIVLSILMFLCCTALLLRPDKAVHWPELAVLGKSALLILTLLGYALLFNPLGFPVVTVAMVFLVSKLFGARWFSAATTAVCVSAIGYLVFDRLLGVTLPIGGLWT